MFKQTLLALSLAAASTAALALPNIAVLATPSLPIGPDKLTVRLASAVPRQCRSWS